MKKNLTLDANVKRYMRVGSVAAGLIDLCDYIPDTESKTMVEIGSFQGESAEVFCQYFKHVHCVDTWNIEHLQGYIDHAELKQNPEDVFDKIIIDRFTNVTKTKTTSKEASDSFDENSIDMVYIDGDHSYDAVKEDILLWSPKVKVGGHITGHDYHEGGAVQKALNETLGIPDIKFQDYSWVIIKK
jgi:hypothetical protein